MVYHGLPIKRGVFHVSHNQMVPQNPVLFRPQIPDGFHSLPQLTAPTDRMARNQLSRSMEGDWKWSDLPHKNHLVTGKLTACDIENR